MSVASNYIILELTTLDVQRCAVTHEPPAASPRSLPCSRPDWRMPHTLVQASVGINSRDIFFFGLIGAGRGAAGGGAIDATRRAAARRAAARRAAARRAAGRRKTGGGAAAVLGVPGRRHPHPILNPTLTLTPTPTPTPTLALTLTLTCTLPLPLTAHAHSLILILTLTLSPSPSHIFPSLAHSCRLWLHIARRNMCMFVCVRCFHITTKVVS